jgi:hypothetical protein
LHVRRAQNHITPYLAPLDAPKIFFVHPAQKSRKPLIRKAFPRAPGQIKNEN